MRRFVGPGGGGQSLELPQASSRGGVNAKHTATSQKAYPSATPATQWRVTIWRGYRENMEDIGAKEALGRLFARPAIW